MSDRVGFVDVLKTYSRMGGSCYPVIQYYYGENSEPGHTKKRNIQYGEAFKGGLCPYCEGLQVVSFMQRNKYIPTTKTCHLCGGTGRFTVE